MNRWFELAIALTSLTVLSSGASTQNTPPAGGQSQGGQAGVVSGVVMGPVTDMVATAIPEVVAAGEKVELLSSDVKSGDGIIGLSDGSALFVELGADSRVLRISPDKQISTVVGRAGIKSIGADRDDHVIALLQDSVEIVYPPANVKVLASGADGLSLRSCNDFVVSSKGGIYLSDIGMYNQPKYTQPTRVHYLPPGGKVRTVADVTETMALPNGIVLSPDEKTLYVADSRNNSGMAWDVASDGSLTNGRAFARNRITAAMEKDFTLQANGLAVDADGRLYVAMPLGVQVFSRGGSYLGTIPAGLKIQSVSFAGPRKEYLYMLAQRAVWRVRTIAHGYLPRAK